ncbi:MAG: winged helix-turn-helix transcriptional regulator [Candidatus Levybacteria bacterium]|nr:winged helix-turn-helix transcriptional regulator [Candidatus Levybacteria bacterium]
MLYYLCMDMYAAIAEPTRRNILEILAENGQLSSTDISNRFPISAPAISQHLKVLKEANLVQMEKRAQQRMYTINPEPMREMGGWLEKLTKHWEEKYSRLDALLEREKNKSKGGGKK